LLVPSTHRLAHLKVMLHDIVMKYRHPRLPLKKTANS